MRRAPFRRAVPVAICIVAMLASLYAVPAGAAAEGHTHAGKSKIPQRCKKYIKSTGTIKFSDWQFPDTLNPAQSALLVTFYVINALFDGLWVYDQHGRLTPQMATEIPTAKNGGIKHGGKTVVIHLKKGLLWSNGAEIVSQDIKFGLAVGKNPASGPVCAGTCDVIKRIDTPDKYTAILRLSSVYAPILAYGIPPIIPHKWSNSVASWNNDPAKAAQVNYQQSEFNFEDSSYPTNGAYQVKQFVKDDRIVMTPFKKYNDMSCGASVKNLIFSFFSGKPGLIAAAAAHDTDVTGGGGGYTPADLTELRKHTDAYTLYQTPSFSFEQLAFNVDSTYDGKPNPLSNLKVRQALSLGLDKIGLIRSALGLGTAPAKAIAAWTPFVLTPKLVQPFADRKVNGQWDPLATAYVSTGSGTALQHARKLLNGTPYKDGFTLDFSTTSGNPVRQAQVAVIQSNWKRLNVNLNVNYIPSSTFFGQYADSGPLHRGTFQVGMFGSSGSPDPDQLKYNAMTKYIDRKATIHTPLNQNYSGISNKTIDQAFNKAGHVADPKVRGRYYATIQELLNKNAYWICLYYRPTIATQSSKVAGFKNNPTQAGPTWNIYQWRLNS